MTFRLTNFIEILFGQMVSGVDTGDNYILRETISFLLSLILIFFFSHAFVRIWIFPLNVLCPSLCRFFAFHMKVLVLPKVALLLFRKFICFFVAFNTLHVVELHKMVHNLISSVQFQINNQVHV